MIETAPTESAEAAAVARPSHQGGPVVPGGLLVEGSCYKRFHVRELTGADEERLTGRSYRSGSEQVTDFLTNVIEGIEGYAGAVTNELVENMLIGDRDYLLLWLRQTTVGDRVNQVMRCPNPACAQKVDVEFFLSELAVKRVETVRPSYELVLSSPAFADDATSNRGAFRLPTGKDQADLEAFSAEGEGRANTRLFSRIVLRLGRHTKLFEEDVRDLPLVVRREIAKQVGEASPGPDLKIDVPCPYCAAEMVYPFDLHSFFLSSWP